MNRIILAALLAAIAIPAQAAERRYTVTEFDRIRIDGPFQVTLATGKAGSAVATGDSRALDRVAVKVEARTLRIGPNRNAWGGYPGEGAGPIAIAVTTHNLRGAIINGSGGVDIDKAKAMDFQASVTGNGRLRIAKVEADKLALAMMGSGRIEVAGAVKQLRADIRGGGDLAARELVAEDAVIGADTAGAIGVGVKRSAKVTATGAGDVEIIGAPACTVDARGAGRVRCGKN